MKNGIKNFCSTAVPPLSIKFYGGTYRDEHLRFYRRGQYGRSTGSGGLSEISAGNAPFGAYFRPRGKPRKRTRLPRVGRSHGRGELPLYFSRRKAPDHARTSFRPLPRLCGAHKTGRTLCSRFHGGGIDNEYDFRAFGRSPRNPDHAQHSRGGRGGNDAGVRRSLGDGRRIFGAPFSAGICRPHGQNRRKGHGRGERRRRLFPRLYVPVCQGARGRGRGARSERGKGFDIRRAIDVRRGEVGAGNGNAARRARNRCMQSGRLDDRGHKEL